MKFEKLSRFEPSSKKLSTKASSLCAVCLLGLALLSPLTAQSPVDQQVAEGTANIYNLDRDARVGGVEIHGSIGNPSRR